MLPDVAAALQLVREVLLEGDVVGEADDVRDLKLAGIVVGRMMEAVLEFGEIERLSLHHRVDKVVGGLLASPSKSLRSRREQQGICGENPTYPIDLIAVGRPITEPHV